MNIFNSICNFKIKACIFGTVLAVLSGTPHSYATQPAQFTCTVADGGIFKLKRSVLATICEQRQNKLYGHGDNHFMPPDRLIPLLKNPSALTKTRDTWIHSIVLSNISPENIISAFINRYKEDNKHKCTFQLDEDNEYYTTIDLFLDKSFFSDEAIYLAASNVDPSNSQPQRYVLREANTEATIQIRIVFKGLKPKPATKANNKRKTNNTQQLDTTGFYIATVYSVFEQKMLKQGYWDLMRIPKSCDIKTILQALREEQVDPEQPVPAKAAPAHLRQQKQPMYSQARKRKNKKRR